jgi:hypothetical protein
LKDLKTTLPHKNRGKSKRFLENRLILEDWQIKVSKIIKNSKKPNFSNKIVYKRTVKKRRTCKKSCPI